MRIILIAILCTFMHANDVLNNQLKQIIGDKFINFYHDYDLNITQLDIKGTMNIDTTKFALKELIFDDKLLTRSQGNFTVILMHNEKQINIPFTFNLQAKMNALIALENIKSKEEINSNNAEITQTDFKSNLVSPKEIDNLSAKSYISSGTIITKEKTGAKIIIRKNEIIEIIKNAKGITLTFSAQAKEDGTLNQIIKVQNQSGKILNVKIISNKQGLLE